MKILWRLVTGCGTVAMLAAISVAPASAVVTATGPVLVVHNPSPGDVLPRSKQVFWGFAFDSAAQSGSGVDRVTVYAGDRDLGARWLGTATAKADVVEGVTGLLGMPNPAKMGTPFAMSGWKLKTVRTLNKSMSGTLFFYARSSVTGMETIITVPNVSIDPGRNTPFIKN